jgi:glycosyltransferase involved in cell wall biosynthesis
VLQVITSTDPRGAELFGVDLGDELAARGFGVRTMALAPGVTQKSALDVPVLGRTRMGLDTMRALRAASRGVDVVIAHGSTTLPACTIALVGSSRPVIYRSVGDPTFWLNTRARRLRTRILLRRTARVVTLTASAAATLARDIGVPSNRIRVIPKGVPTARFNVPSAHERASARAQLGLSEGSRVALYLGALSPEKNVATIIEAIAPLADVVLLVVGDGPDREQLERSVPAEVASRVRFLGSTDDPLPMYHASDVVVLASLTEGLPGVLIEAGLCGLPTVATDVGFVREIIDGGRTGVVVPPRDVAAMTDGVTRALDDATALGAAARVRCREHFALDRVADAWDQLIRDVAASRH